MGCSESNVGCTIVLWAAIYSVNSESPHYFLWHGHGSPHNVSLVGISGRTTEGRTDNVKTVYPPYNFVIARGIITKNVKYRSRAPG